MGLRRELLLLLAAVLFCGCRQSNSREVVVYTSIDQPFSEPVLKDFERETGIHVRAVFDTEETKSTGVLNRLIAEAGSPQADVFWSGDPVRPFVLIRRGLVAPYLSPEAAKIPASFKDPSGLWTGGAARIRVVLVNKNLVPLEDRPHSMKDFLAPRWKGRTAIANPVFGTTTMHVAALFVAWGEDRAREFLTALKENGVRVASSNGEVKRLVSTGEVAFGLADTDDASEAVKEGAPIEAVFPDQDGAGTLAVPTSVVLMKSAPHSETGKRLIDYLLSAKTERALSLSAAHVPLRADVEPASGVRRLSAVRTLSVDYGQVGEAVERFQPFFREWAGL
jgi:iron(III) transport system substrate-binding protein